MNKHLSIQPVTILYHLKKMKETDEYFIEDFAERTIVETLQIYDEIEKNRLGMGILNKILSLFHKPIYKFNFKKSGFFGGFS